MQTNPYQSTSHWIQSGKGLMPDFECLGGRREKGGSIGSQWVGSASSSVDCSHPLKSEVGVAFDVSVIQSTKAPKHLPTSSHVRSPKTIATLGMQPTASERLGFRIQS